MKKNIVKAFASDMVYSIAALVVFNGVIQLLVNPYLTNQMGAAAFGVILSIQSVVSIMASSFGTGANYSRMVVSTKSGEVKGDYNIFLSLISLISLVVTLVMLLVFKELNPVMYISAAVLMIASIFRYYGDVNFKLALNYKGYFVYYAVMAAGYVIGTLTYRISHSWGVALCMGEVLATLFVLWKGNIYRRPLLERSNQFAHNMKSVWILSSAYLISGIIMNADRILIMLFIGSAEVTVFYTATLIGKIVAMLTSPLNGVVIGYLSRYDGKLSRKMMLALSGALLVVGLVVSLASIIVSDIFVKIMYPDIYAQAQPLFFLANAGQVFFFISESLMVVVLRFTGEKLQVYLNAAYAVVFFAATIPAVIFGGLWGIALAILVINIVRFAAVTLVGMFYQAPTEYADI